MVKKLCKYCSKEIFAPKRKFCSKSCKDSWRYYNITSVKEKMLETTKRWNKLNPEKCKKSNKKACDKFRKEKPERFNELMMNGYRRDKDKWNSRSRTGKFFMRYRNYLIKECKKCKSKENLEIHHEIYPIKTKEIKKAIDEGKIYYLCLKCHGRRNHHGK